MPRFRISNPATGAGHPRITPGSFSQVTEDRLRSVPVLDVATANAKLNFGLVAAPPVYGGALHPAMTSLNTPTGYELNGNNTTYENSHAALGLLPAFDGVIPVSDAFGASCWLQANSWLGIKLPVAKAANMLRVTQPHAGLKMNAFSIQGGNGWAGPWVTFASFNATYVFGADRYRREYAFDSVVPYTHYRVLIDTIYGNEAHIGELEFSYDQPYELAHAPMTGPTSPSPLVATVLNAYSAGYPAWHAFDNSLSSTIYPNDIFPFVAAIDTGVATPVDAVDIILNSTGATASAYTIDGSNDGTTWTNIITETNQTRWTPTAPTKVRHALEVRVTFRHYRWRCTAGASPVILSINLLVKA